MEQSRHDPDEAPGLKRRARKDGIAYYWVASAVSKHAVGYPLKTVRVHGDADTIAQRCRVMTAELRLWLSEQGRGDRPIYDGSLKSLIAVYRKTAESPYHAVKHNTRQMYDESLDLLETTVGDRQLSRLTGLDFRRWYTNLKAPAEHTAREIEKAAGAPLPVKPERMRRAYKAMQLLRIIVKFGAVAGITECVRLRMVLEDLEFSAPAARTEALTFDQVKAICDLAIAQDRLSVAVAQALQFELTLRQIDVIGEWELAEPEDGGIVDRGQRWSGGALWSHIGGDGLFEKQTTKQLTRGKLHVARHDTMAYPFLRSILDRVPEARRIGPMVKDETTGLPYRQRHFISVWRALADQAGVPRNVWNRDSRAGGVTEGSDAGADIEHLRHHATHSNAATTSRYNRNTVEKTRKVAQLRVAHRGEQK